MAIAAGTRFGPYEIVEPIGAGGMGEVYKGRDTRLDRTIAIKILPELHAAEPQFRERFEREARALSQLTHPHICTLHDVGEHGGTPFLVMEFLVGETLAARLERGPVPLNDALTTAIEIAEALDVAHRAGIVHRDLKPGNVIVTKKGAKLLDFGLAKLRASGHGPVAGVTAAVTGTAPLTGQGSILGTLQYMSPEQLEGKDADARSDVFAFGAIVHEMVTGKRAFEAASQASLIAAILKDTPPSIATETMAPPALDRIVRTCLAKDPDDRWQSAGDLKRELQWIAETPSATGEPAAVALQRRSPIGERVGWATLGLVLGGLLVGFGVWRTARSAPAAPSRPTHLSIVVPADAPIDTRQNRPSIALSPDGRRLVYVAERNNTTQLFVRPLDQGDARPVPGTEGALNPFFSPDGEWVGFVADRKLKKVALSGGTPIILCDTAEDDGPVWGSEDSITLSATTGLVQVAAAGGATRPLTMLDAQHKESAHLWPDFLPGGKAVIFSVWTGQSFDDTPIVVQTLQSSERRDLGIKGTFARYVPSGHIVYAKAGSVMAVPFDAARLTVTGPPVQVVDGILMHNPSGAAQFSFSRTGAFVYIAAQGASQRDMVWVDRRGTNQPLPIKAQPFVFPRLSSDGQQLIFANGTGRADIWLYQVARETLTRLTFDNTNVRPIWTPDGKQITFTSSRAGPLNMFSMPADSSAAPERLLESQYTQFPSSWSPDGQHLAYMEINPTTAWDIWVLPRAKPSAPQPFLRTSFQEGWLEFSPNGRWVAYTSDESGRFEVYVRPFPGPGGKVQISSDGGTEAVWAPNGRELFYRNRDQMMAVAVTMDPTFSAGKQRLLFEGRYDMGPVPGMTNYDVSRDGEHFLMLKGQTGSTPSHVDIVLDWFGDVARKAPAGSRK